MVDFDLEVDVQGPYAAQPRLVKLGVWLAFLGSLTFGLFLPTSLVVAVIFGVGGPAANWVGVAGPIGFCCVFGAIGAWVNFMFVTWLRNGDFDLRGKCLLLVCVIGLSALIAGTAVALGLWQNMFLYSFAMVLVLFVVCFVFISVGQMLGGRKS